MEGRRKSFYMKGKNMLEKKDIRSLNYEEVQEWIISIGEKAFRAKQIYSWIHQKQAEKFEEMNNLSKTLREKLSEECLIKKTEVIEKLESSIDGTCKFLFRLEDGNLVESVLMRYKHGNSVCISSQVGCRMGCHFCASTLDGLTRNLEPSEMLGQIYTIQRLTQERVSNVVVMGSGEPFDNYDNILKFLHMLSDENGLNISQRNITVSTCGIVEKIYALAEEKLQITLAISLHAPNDTVRKELMPVANRYTMKEILEACQYYFQQTGRRITFEYSLVEGVNDSETYAKQLAGYLKAINCHVNLIPVNPIKERGYKDTKRKYVENFKNILEKNRINVTIRREMGRDINAACGQLRKRYIDEKNTEEEL